MSMRAAAGWVHSQGYKGGKRIVSPGWGQRACGSGDKPQGSRTF